MHPAVNFILRKARCSLLLLLLPARLIGEVTVSNVTAVQIEGTRQVAISYDLEQSDDLASSVVVEALAEGSDWTTLNSVSGDVGELVHVGTGKAIVWNAADDWPAQLFPAVQIRVTADDGQPPVELSLVSSGSFEMGSPESELGRLGDETQNSVTLTRDLYVGRTEVTWNQWTAARDQALSNGYTDIHDKGTNGHSVGASGEYPVTNVSWWHVVKWCNLRSQVEGLTPVYYTDPDFAPGAVFKTGEATIYANFAASGYRLPTEAEWEYAARAGSSTAFHSGEITNLGTSPLDPNLDRAGWYSGNSESTIREVGQKEANAFGLYDVHGNVYEWCWDWYGAYSTDPTDPKGPDSGTFRVIRGGSWESNSQACRSAFRNKSGLFATLNVGFRVVRTETP